MAQCVLCNAVLVNLSTNPGRLFISELQYFANLYCINNNTSLFLEHFTTIKKSNITYNDAAVNISSLLCCFKELQIESIVARENIQNIQENWFRVQRFSGSKISILEVGDFVTLSQKMLFKPVEQLCFRSSRQSESPRKDF